MQLDLLNITPSGTPETDKCLILSILDYVLKVCKVAIKTSILVKQKHKARLYAQKYKDISHIIKYLISLHVPCFIELDEMTATYICGEVYVYIEETDDIVVRLQPQDADFRTIVTLSKVEQLLDELYNEVTEHFFKTN